MAIVEFRGGPINYKYLMNKTKSDLAFMVLESLDRIAKLEGEQKQILHSHPGMEAQLGVPPDHVIVDRKEFERINNLGRRET